MDNQLLQIQNRTCRIYGTASAEYLLLQMVDEHDLAGMEREVEQLFCGCNLNYIALVDNADSVGDKADDGEVMRDEEVGGSSLLLELFKKVQNLRTNGNVKSRYPLLTFPFVRRF